MWENEPMIQMLSKSKNMSNGMRDNSRTPLLPKEIHFVKSEIQRIGADESIFVFNDERHIGASTCYDFVDDVIYVTRNVFPDDKYGSTHPRDLMSVGAVLAHEYYGHRTFREEYLLGLSRGGNFPTMPLWKDECRASITAAKIAKNLTDKERSDLIVEAIFRAKEYGYFIEMDDFMKEVVYGYSREKSIANYSTAIHFVSETSVMGEAGTGICECCLPQMPSTPGGYDDTERGTDDRSM